MLRYARSPSSSPARKRQRLSSPTYDDQVGDLSIEHLQAFDLIEAQLSQATSSQPAHDDKGFENPFFTKASALQLSGPAKDDPFDDSDELAEKEKLYDSFLDSTPLDGLPMFQSAKLMSSTLPVPTFRKASNKENEGSWIPSKEALEKANQKMKVWEKDWDDLDEPVDDDPAVGELPLPETPMLSSARAIASSSTFMPLVPPPPATPAARNIPLGFSSQSKPFRIPTFKAPTATPGPSQTPFRPPTQQGYPTATPGPSQAPFRPPTQSSYATASTPLRPLFRPPLSTPGSTSFQPPRATSTPRSIGLSRNSKSAFKTPFKVPGSANRNPLQQLLKQNIMNQAHIPPPSPLSARSTPLAISRNGSGYAQTPSKLLPSSTKPSTPSKKPLISCGLRPQEYDSDELASMGINVTELNQITPLTALHYGFYTTEPLSPQTSTATSPRQNAEAAYQELQAKGCHLATKPWVDNHWCLILWKLAGMAVLDPTSEQNPERKRWCWSEVMRQLIHRYEKELNGGQRPALRRIVAQDSPVGNPLVLCISAINWVETERGTFPELEVTDGWYRVQAQIDPTMARAVRRGLIRPGRKIAVVGARLLSEKKDPMEILEAYDSVKLAFSGNSTHLAPWHAKLGFQRDRYISTLRSLSADGGLISCVDIEILKAHPIAFVEFVERDGQQVREGPRNEADENRIADEWLKRREKEASKLRYEYERHSDRYMDYSYRLESKASSYRVKDDDGPPDSIDSYYDELEEHQTALQVINRLTASEAYWLIKTIRQNLANEHEKMNLELEKELDALCPPRNVRNFRVLVVKDAHTDRKISHRVAQLTVWDVAGLVLSEDGKPGSFQVGQRYMVSNLVPTQTNAWMKEEPGAEIFMATRKGSQWLRIRS